MVESLSHPVVSGRESRTSSSEGSLWPGDPDRTPLPVQLPNKNQVDLWFARLDIPQAALARFEPTLSEDERDRAFRFRLELHQRRYIAAHGWLRRVLARYLDTPAPAVQFVFGPRGKPELSPSSNPASLRFNMAHSQDFAAIAIATNCDIGVDIEQVRPIPEAADLVTRFFSLNESGLFHSLPEELQAAAFFNLWTRKEAWLKATGEGIAHLLNQVEVSFIPGEPANLLKMPARCPDPGPWSLKDVSVEPGVVVAVAARCAPLEVRTKWAERFFKEAL